LSRVQKKAFLLTTPVTIQKIAPNGPGGWAPSKSHIPEIRILVTFPKKLYDNVFLFVKRTDVYTGKKDAKVWVIDAQLYRGEGKERGG
jgi:hypothetical protein